MRLIYRLFNRIICVFIPKRHSSPQDIPEKLDAEALANALREASFLRSQSVEVRELRDDEIPGLPKKAD